MLHEKEKEKSQAAAIREGTGDRPPYWKIFRQAFPQLFNVFFVFFVTLSVFPAVHSGELFNFDFFLPINFK